MRKCRDLSVLGPLMTSGPDDACKFGNTFIVFFTTLMQYTVADKKSSRFHCVQRRFVSVPLAFRFRFRFPLRFVAESVPYKVNGGQTVKNKYACLSYEYYN